MIHWLIEEELTMIPILLNNNIKFRNKLSSSLRERSTILRI
jgi:hypothetical protein